MRCSAAILLCSLLTCDVNASEKIVIHRVVGPEFPGRYKHPATVAQLDTGDLYIAYYGGEGEYQGDTAVYGLRLVKGSREWTKPEIMGAPD